VERKHDYSKMPGGTWLMANIGLLIGLVVALALFVWLCLRARKAGRVVSSDKMEESEPLTGGAAV
jgi:hypothetical protein